MRVLDLRAERNLDALDVDDQVSTGQHDAVWDASPTARLVPDRGATVYRSRTTSQQGANYAFPTRYHFWTRGVAARRAHRCRNRTRSPTEFHRHLATRGLAECETRPLQPRTPLASRGCMARSPSACSSRNSDAGRKRRPQYAGATADGEVSLQSPVIERLLGNNEHSRAFRERPVNSAPDHRPDRDSGPEHPALRSRVPLPCPESAFARTDRPQTTRVMGLTAQLDGWRGAAGPHFDSNESSACTATLDAASLLVIPNTRVRQSLSPTG